MTDTWNPEQYDKFKTERSQPFFDLLDLIPKESCFAHALDLGCGTGELTAVLHERFDIKHTLGIDNSEKMLEKIPQKPDLSFKNAAIEDAPTLGKFDLLFSNAALQWCSDHQDLFTQLREAVNPGGQIAFQMPMNHDYPTHVLARELAHQEPFRSWIQPGDDLRPSLLTPEKYADLLFHLGFREQKVLLKVYGHVLEDREAVVEWVKGTMLTAFEKKLTPEQFTPFVDEFRRCLFKVLPDEKPFFYPFKRLLLWGRLQK